MKSVREMAGVAGGWGQEPERAVEEGQAAGGCEDAGLRRCSRRLNLPALRIHPQNAGILQDTNSDQLPRPPLSDLCVTLTSSILWPSREMPTIMNSKGVPPVF